MSSEDMTQQPGESSPNAAQVIVDLLCLLSVEQVRAYLEKTGWVLFANHFVRGKGWSLQPDMVRPSSWIYIKPDTEAADTGPQRVVVEVPAHEEAWGIKVNCAMLWSG